MGITNFAIIAVSVDFPSSIFRGRQEFAYALIRKSSFEVEDAVRSHEHYSSHAKFRYGPRWQWPRETTEEEARLARAGAVATARLHR